MLFPYPNSTYYFNKPDGQGAGRIPIFKTDKKTSHIFVSGTGHKVWTALTAVKNCPVAVLFGSGTKIFFNYF
jgi:hypothetical protein